MPEEENEGKGGFSGTPRGSLKPGFGGTSRGSLEPGFGGTSRGSLELGFSGTPRGSLEPRFGRTPFPKGVFQFFLFVHALIWFSQTLVRPNVFLVRTNLQVYLNPQNQNFFHRLIFCEFSFLHKIVNHYCGFTRDNLI